MYTSVPCSNVQLSSSLSSIPSEKMAQQVPHRTFLHCLYMTWYLLLPSPSLSGRPNSTAGSVCAITPLVRFSFCHHTPRLPFAFVCIYSKERIQQGVQNVQSVQNSVGSKAFPHEDSRDPSCLLSFLPTPPSTSTARYSFSSAPSARPPYLPVSRTLPSRKAWRRIHWVCSYLLLLQGTYKAKCPLLSLYSYLGSRSNPF